MNWSNRLFLLPVTAAILLGTVSCGRGDKSASGKAIAVEAGEKPAPTSNDKKQKLSIPQRMAALKELGKKFDSLPGKDFAADNQAMLTWLQGRPEYEASGISKSGSVWARFTDGRVVGLLRSRDAKGRPVLGSAGGGQRSPDQAPAASPPFDKKSMFMMPSSRQVRILNHPSMEADDSWRPYLLPPQTAKWFEAAGYTKAHGDPSVEGLKKTSGDGVFFFETHGGSVPITKGGDDVVNFLSSSPVSDEHEVLFAEDLDEGRLLSFRISAHEDEGWWYAITPAFVREYMSFADNALVFINSCDSAANDTMRNACFAKGASVFVGWSSSSWMQSSYRASTFFFDRLLAANQYVPEAPKQRPFDFGAVYRDMRQRNYDTDLGDKLSNAEKPPLGPAGAAGPQEPSPASQEKRGKDTCYLVIHHKSGHTFAGLRPSIEYLSVSEPKEELNLLGYFGAKQGQVKINGHAVTVKSCTATNVVVALPSFGPGSAGPVVVEVDGRHSNVVPLTEWRGQFRYTQEDYSNGPTLKRTATFDLHFRADVHAYRLVPHEDPRLVGAKGGLNKFFMPVKDSKVQWTFSGQATDRNKNTRQLKGSGTITAQKWYDAVKDGPAFTFMGDLDARQKVVNNAKIAVGGPYGTETFTSSVNGQSSNSPAFLDTMPDIDKLKFDGQFTIKAGKVKHEWNKTVGTLEWDDIPAKHLPSAETLAVAPRPSRELAFPLLPSMSYALLGEPWRQIHDQGK